MARLKHRIWVWQFASPPEVIWPLLADTARFNEAAALPKHDIEETPQDDGSVLYLGSVRMGPFALEWQERPVNWVANRWFEHCRDFRRGPLKTLCARFELAPDGTGCKGTYSIEASAANWLGEVILATGFLKSAGRTFSAMASSADEFGQGTRTMPFDYQAPEPPVTAKTRARSLAEAIEATGYGHGLSQRLIELIFTGQEVDVGRIRPLSLARQWQVSGQQMVECCLQSTRAGLLDLRWDLLCPRCRVAKSVVRSLDSLPQGAHCDTCNIDYDRDFSKNVELSFQPTAALRPVEMGEYCLFGPMSTPHIKVHLTLAAGEERRIDLALPPGTYRLRTLEAGPEAVIDFGDGAFPKVLALPNAMASESGDTVDAVTLINRCALEKTLIIEEQPWRQDALTADKVTTLQAFRDLFSDQVLRPGDEVAVRRIALLFSDLRDSTALYNRIGDAAAYHLVRDHFAYLASRVRHHEGAIVKTIGDAIMAVFAEPAQALTAALEIQREIKDFNDRYPDNPIAIKLGLHVGASIAVTLNGQLDYFGSTVNMAARLQSRSEGGDIVLSEAMLEDPDIQAQLEALPLESATAELKGFAEPVPFYRLRP